MKTITAKKLIDAGCCRKESIALLREALTEDRQLERLYRYFMPNPPKQAKTALQWIARACDPDDVRPALRYLYSDGVTVCGTNGKLLHYGSIGIKPAGYYDPKTFDQVDFDGQYPDIHRVIPNRSPEKVFVLSEHPIVETMKGVFAYDLDGHLFDRKYIDLAANGHKTVLLSLGKTPTEAAIGASEFDDCYYVIMPILMR